MFISRGAVERIIQMRRQAFLQDFVVKLLEEGKKLGFTKAQVIALIEKSEEGGKA